MARRAHLLLGAGASPRGLVSNRPLSDGDVQLILKLPPSIGIGEPGVCRQVQPLDQPAPVGTWLACCESTRNYDSYGVVQRK